jgi:hypothetical protein
MSTTTLTLQKDAMDAPDSSQLLVEPFRLTTPRQERIYHQLNNLVSHGAAEFYQDACHLMAMHPPLATTTHLVGHALREVDSSLRAVLLPLNFPEPPQCPACGTRPEGHKQRIDHIAKEYGFSSELHQAWLDISVDRTSGLHHHAHRDDLDLPRGRDQTFDAFFDRFEEVLEAVLNQAAVGYTNALDQLDRLLEKAEPTNDELRWLKTHVPNNANTLGYFFQRLRHPRWLPRLRSKGFFDRPPDAVQDPTTGRWRYLPWPQGEYLVHMAAVDETQSLVAAIASQIADTSNPYVQGDLAAIMAALPADLAASLVAKKVQWLDGGGAAWLEDERLAQLVLTLTRGGHADMAWTLLKALLSSLAKTTHGVYVYEQVRQQTVPELLDYTRVAGLDHLCDLLQDQVADSVEAQSAPNDYSDIWRPAIEDHPQNYGPYTPRDVLVVAIRDGAVRLVREGRAPLPDVLDALERRPWSIFARIALHVLRVTDNANAADLAVRLVDRARFDNPGLWHEYFLLLRDRFGQLGAVEQAEIIGWLEAGPPNPDLADLVRGAELWRWRRLAVLHNALPEEWQQRYTDLVARFGEEEQPEFLSLVTAGDAQPDRDAVRQYLHALSVPAVAEYVRTWRPSGRLFDLMRGGLGNILADLAREQPMRFSQEAPEFAGAHPVCLAGLLRGWENAVQQQRAIAWEPVLDLCDQSLAPPPAERDHNANGNGEDAGAWPNLRMALASLVTVGLGGDRSKIPLALRRRVWDLLQRLASDDHPTPDDEAHWLSVEPASRALNTVRGLAVRAVVAYALWVRRHAQGSSFADMPEAADTLDAHVDIARDPAVTVHVLFGQFLPNLAYLDADWTQARVDIIFPRQPEHAALREVTWDAYVVFNRASRETFDLLRDDYRWAIDRVRRPGGRQRYSADPDVRLAQHLMGLVWVGAVGVDPLDEVLDRLYSMAPDDVRAEAIVFVGRGLYHSEGDVLPEVLPRVQALWESRMAGTHTAGAKELAAFGWWYGSGKLDSAWALAQLEEVLGRTDGAIDAQHLVGEQLARQATTAPRSVMRCLRHLVDKDLHGQRIDLWQEEARAMLAAALRSGDDEARRQGEAVANVLVAQGFLQYRDLLSGDMLPPD